MVNAKLHLICGNCGCNDEWEYEIDNEGKDIDGVLYPEVRLCCKNCGTIHSLEEVNAKDKTVISVSLEESFKSNIDSSLYYISEDLKDYNHNRCDKKLDSIIEDVEKLKEYIKSPNQNKP